MFDDFEDFVEQYAPGMKARKVPGMLYRKGGDATDWATPGSSTYIPTALYFQGGSIQWSGVAATSGSVSYNFPHAYYGEPLLFVQVMSSNPSSASITTRATSAGDALEIYWRSDVPVTSVILSWLAYGGQLNK